jgi:hypothetical protein
MGVVMWLAADNAMVGAWVDQIGLGFLKMHFLHAAAFLAVLSLCLLFGISLLTKESGKELFESSRKRVLSDMEPTAKENKQFLVWVIIVAVVYFGTYALFW